MRRYINIVYFGGVFIELLPITILYDVGTPVPRMFYNMIVNYSIWSALETVVCRSFFKRQYSDRKLKNNSFKKYVFTMIEEIRNPELFLS